MGPTNCQLSSFELQHLAIFRATTTRHRHHTVRRLVCSFLHSLLATIILTLIYPFKGWRSVDLQRHMPVYADQSMCKLIDQKPILYVWAFNDSTGDVSQYADNVPGNGSNFDNAYFEISYIRTYTTSSAIPSATAGGVGGAGTTHATSPAPTPTTGNSVSSSAMHSSSLLCPAVILTAMVLISVVAGMLEVFA